MDNNKLQELTDKLYREGLEKGQKEGEERLNAAKEEASNILSGAKVKADEILAAARKEAQEIKKNAEAEIKMSFRQSFLTIRQQVEKLVVAKAVSEPVRGALKDEALVKELLATVAKSFNPSGDVALSAIVPEAMRAQLEGAAGSAVRELLGKEAELKFDSQVKAGFKIGPKEDGYYISFTDKDLESIVREYMRPYLTSLLFGGEQ